MHRRQVTVGADLIRNLAEEVEEEVKRVGGLSRNANCECRLCPFRSFQKADHNQNAKCNGIP